ncbi:MAG: DODA-type extradiol aromatic ring-opening family dioxygenase, partial [Rhodospirillales bacterium]
HEGVCIAEEAPHLIPGLSYNRPGDRAFAEAMVEDWHAGDLPAYTVETPHFHWDYGSAIPLQYLDPDATIPAVLTPTCYASDIDENIKVGELLDETAKRMNKRVILVVSNALTHLIVRGPDKWPLDEHIAMDHKFIDMIKEADVDGALDYLPEYARDAKCEMGGRGLGVFLGAAKVLQNKSGDLSGAMYGPYAQSSGSGNANLSLVPAK